jgi:NadR type nicotinamide-nucleotide adenylyltransferase
METKHEIRKIAFIGPESSGKTYLATHFARLYDEPLVAEFAREYLQGKTSPYRAEELLTIAEKQMEAEKAGLLNARRFLFCDTEILSIKVWQEIKYGKAHPQLDEWYKNQPYHFYFLLQPDLPYQPDPLRESPSPADRQAIFAHFQHYLDQHGHSYCIISGKTKNRIENIRKTLESRFP